MAGRPRRRARLAREAREAQRRLGPRRRRRARGNPRARRNAKDKVELGSWIGSNTGPLYAISRRSLPSSMQMQKDEVNDRYSEILAELSEEAQSKPERSPAKWLKLAKAAANEIERSRKKTTSLDVRPAKGSFVAHGLESESSIDPEGGGKLGGYDRESVESWKQAMLREASRYDHDKLTPEKVLHYIESRPPAEQTTLLLFFYRVVQKAATSLSQTQEGAAKAIRKLEGEEAELDMKVRIQRRRLARVTERYQEAHRSGESYKVTQSLKDTIAIARTELDTAKFHAQPGSTARQRIRDRIRTMQTTDYGLLSLRSDEVQKKLKYLKSRMQRGPGKDVDAGYSRKDISRVFGIPPSDVNAAVASFRRHLLAPPLPAASGRGAFRYQKRRGR